MFKKIMHLLCLKFKALFAKSEDGQVPAKQEATVATVTAENTEAFEISAVSEATVTETTVTERGNVFTSEALEESMQETMQDERTYMAEVYDALKNVPHVGAEISQECGETEQENDGFEILITEEFEPEEPEETFLSAETSKQEALTSQAQTPERVENWNAHEEKPPERVEKSNDAMGDQQEKSPEEAICDEYPEVTPELAHLVCMSEDMSKGTRYRVENFGGSHEVLVQLNQQLGGYLHSGIPFKVQVRKADLKDELRLIIIQNSGLDCIKENVTLQRKIEGTLFFMGFRYDLDEEMYCWGEKSPCPEAGDRR